METVGHYQVAIIGAGFCGTMVAVNLTRIAPSLPIAVIDRRTSPALGLAYGTTDPDHLLNVRAGQMGAFNDDPQHFFKWLQTGAGKNLIPDVTEKTFAPRRIYGRYLQFLLQEAQTRNPSLAALNLDITALRRRSNGGFEVITSQQILTADHVVLALGNFPPEASTHSATSNPYTPETWQHLAEPGDVLIVGTGLTALDLVVTLAKTKASGAIHLLSRHGLLPREHTEPASYNLTWRPPYPNTVLGLCRKLRREIAEAHKQNLPWQAVIDALRPLNQILWQQLGFIEQRRFLRHLRAWWDVHRHRCAPQIMDVYRALEAQGRIFLHHGAIIAETATGKGIDITWRPRGETQTKTLKVNQIVRCTGPQADFGKLADPLVRNMLRSGLITPDSLRLGVATADLYVPASFDGENTDGLYVLGSLIKGRLYESVAVPELRRQAAAVAERIAMKVLT